MYTITTQNSFHATCNIATPAVMQKRILKRFSTCKIYSFTLHNPIQSVGVLGSTVLHTTVQNKPCFLKSNSFTCALLVWAVRNSSGLFQLVTTLRINFYIYFANNFYPSTCINSKSIFMTSNGCLHFLGINCGL